MNNKYEVILFMCTHNFIPFIYITDSVLRLWALDHTDYRWEIWSFHFDWFWLT